jgi:cytosine/adenosine deaminase-related metal-dependent hydrolase
MILNNVKTAGTDAPVNIWADKDNIINVSVSPFTGANGSLQLTFEDAIVFPGLINSHDHLDFNLFPQLGNRIYNNYTEWGNHIHKSFKKEINAVLEIPVALRSQWGVYKNLLCGVTTVVNHGEKLPLGNSLLTVFEKSHSLHSVHFEKNWGYKLNNPLKLRQPVAIHVGEGDDWLAFSEIEELINTNFFKRKLIGVHAVSMLAYQAKKFDAIVWCPQSNYFLLNKTAQVDLLQKSTNILFGTDSTLTSEWDIWEHLRLARKTGLLADRDLYQALNKKAAKTWKLHSGEIAVGKTADLVVAKANGKKGYDAFFELTPADLLLIVQQGNVQLFDKKLLPQLKMPDIAGYSRIYVNGACKYVKGDLGGLMKKIKAYNPAIEFPISLNNPVCA